MFKNNDTGNFLRVLEMKDFFKKEKTLTIECISRLVTNHFLCNIKAT